MSDLSAEQGVEAEWFSSRPALGDPFKNRELIREMADLQRKDGATFFRYTIDGDVLWVEGWRVQPHKQAPFNPPYTLEKP